jgi:hypothetical protein
VVHEVIAGHVLGQARAAVEESTGRVIYAVDARGACTPASIELFESAYQRPAPRPPALSFVSL